MEFRLIYEGSLPPEKWSYTEQYARAEHKQKVRKFLHPQLRELWSKHPDLRRLAEQKYVRASEDRPWLPANEAIPVGSGTGSNRRVFQGAMVVGDGPASSDAKTWLEYIADDHITCNGNRFVPLINVASGFTCSLDILFLRRDAPGGTWNAGDIDSRIKVLFDGLRMPKQVQELGGLAIEDDETPFHCLLEDDSLITSHSVTTDRLLKPSGANINDVLMVIHVTVVNPSAIFSGGSLL